MPHALSAKQEVLEAIRRLPDTVGIEEVIYQCYVLENIRRGRRDSAEDKTQPVAEMLEDIQSW